MGTNQENSRTDIMSNHSKQAHQDVPQVDLAEDSKTNEEQEVNYGTLNASIRDVSNLESSVAVVPGMEQTDIYDNTNVINAG